MGATSIFQITSEGLVYAGLGRNVSVEDAISLFSNLLYGKSKAAAFNALAQCIPAKWTLQDDTVNPFGDRRQVFLTMYTFDLDADILFASKDAPRHEGKIVTSHLQMPLRRFREHRLITTTDLVPAEPVSVAQLDLRAFPSPSWKPSTTISPRTVTFVTRILSDFCHQWRHVLRNPYNDITFRKLARAAISIATQEFRIAELVSRFPPIPERRGYVEVYDLPSWDPYNEHLFCLRGTVVLLDQDLVHAMDLVKEHAAKNRSSNQPITYFVLSVRHVMLLRTNEQGALEYTAPASFLNGNDMPSSQAIEILLQGLQCAVAPPRTPLHDLPSELQDGILEYVSEGPIEAARLGCLLRLGTPFNWMRKEGWGRGQGPVETRLSYTRRDSGRTPVESQIWFGEIFSGLVYL